MHFFGEICFSTARVVEIKIVNEIPSGYVKIALENGHLGIVICSIENMVFLHIFMLNYQRVLVMIRSIHGDILWPSPPKAHLPNGHVYI